MSLSQKHSGKVLAPWFNRTEWKIVYKLIYNDGTQNWTKALKILKVWKIRTPLLPAGAEGTLLILEALLFDTNKKPHFEASHVLSTSLVRFLNLCAANSDRQGMFYKTALKNGLPRWLISIRHDIAHSHQVPSLSMLELSLKFCLGWLKEKYWDVQYEHMTDFVVDDVDEGTLKNALNLYLLLLSKNIDPEKATNDIQNFIPNYNLEEFSKVDVLGVFENVIEELTNKNSEKVGNVIGAFLTNQSEFLQVEVKLDSFGIKRFSAPDMEKWLSLLHLIHKMGAMTSVIVKIFEFVCDSSRDMMHRETGSIWLHAIFDGLIKNECNLEGESGITFISNNSVKDKHFVEEVMTNLTPFTGYFLKEVLHYNNMPFPFIEDCVKLLSAFSIPSITENSKIFTLDDLNPYIDATVSNISNSQPKSVESRWVLIEDVSPYVNLPLGILPHQDISTNPLLDL